MANKYSDIIGLRQSKASYYILKEESGEWTNFIANDQFNEILRRVISAVRNDDIDAHKSFWIEGTYGTGKSHAGSVIGHLLCDSVDQIREYVEEEFKSSKNVILRNSIYKLREKKSLFPVVLYGSCSISHKDDLSLQLQKNIKNALANSGIEIIVKTDFDNYIEHIDNNHDFWDLILKQSPALAAIAPDRKKLISNLKDNDTGTIQKIKDALRDGGLDVRLNSNNLVKWFFEVQNELREKTTYNGLLILWDEFTDVMTSDIGPALLVSLQELAEATMNSYNDSYFFFISHPSALNSLKADERDKTKGRYHYMKYNMEPVSAFKIMSSKFRRVGSDQEFAMVSEPFFAKCNDLLDTYSNSTGSSNPDETRADIKNLFPLHPSTANLATYYAREAGSSSRSVFEFLGDNPAIRNFLDNQEYFASKAVITADYLWDYVVDAFNDNVAKFGAVTERFNSYREHVEQHLGPDYYTVFKGVLLLNALNNIANNNTVTPSEENIKNLYIGTPFEYSTDKILDKFNTDGIIQRAPGGLFSIQFSALPAKDIEDTKQRLMATDFRYTWQVINFPPAAREEFDKYLSNVARPCSYDLYSSEANSFTLLNKVENRRKLTKDYELYLALMVAKNNEELDQIKDITAIAAAEDRFASTTFIVFAATFGDKNYERFIEYQANADCARQHGFADQQQSNTKLASDMLREWIKEIRRGVFETYVNGETISFSALKLPTVINVNIAPKIFSLGAESLDIIKEKFSKTYWKKALVKETVKSILSFNTKQDICDHCKGPAIHVQYILQDSVDENLEFKSDINPNHPLLKVCEFVNTKIKYADKQNQFNLSDKFIELTKPPYGLYQSHAGMAMLAFALRPWVGKFFDNNGRPRENQHVAEDVVEVFKCWEDGKTGLPKLSFRFETPEEGKLCKAFIDIFNLTDFQKAEEIMSLKNARWTVIHSYLPKKSYPLWAIKYYPGEIKEEVRTLVDNLNAIVTEVGSSNPSLMTEVLENFKTWKFEFKELIKKDRAFSSGFLEYLKTVEMVNIIEDEFDSAFDYIKSHLQSEVGMWTEAEVKDALKNWRLNQRISIPTDPYLVQPSDVAPNPFRPQVPNYVENQVYNQNKQRAEAVIESINNLEIAKAILRRLAQMPYNDVLEKIIEG